MCSSELDLQNETSKCNLGGLIFCFVFSGLIFCFACSCILCTCHWSKTTQPNLDGIGVFVWNEFLWETENQILVEIIFLVCLNFSCKKWNYGGLPWWVKSASSVYNGYLLKKWHTTAHIIGFFFFSFSFYQIKYHICNMLVMWRLAFAGVQYLF